MLCFRNGMGPQLNSAVGYSVATKKRLKKASASSDHKAGTSKNAFSIGIFVCASLIVVIVFSALYYHFFMAGDIPGMQIRNQNSAQYWGQLGDFAGGLLNPILSFLALMAVLKALALQRAEMRAAQDEARAANLEQKVQSNLYMRQAFESSFFGLLDVHSRILSDMRCNATGRLVAGREAVDMMLTALKSSTAYKGAILYSYDIDDVTIQNEIDSFCLRYKAEVGHYFRNLYWILKKIDNGRFGSDPDLEEKNEGFRERRSFFDYLRKRQYASLVRAQLSEGELALLQLNCLGPYGEGLKEYVEKYSLIKSVDPNFFGSWSSYINGKFHPLAIKSSHQITIEDLRAFTVSNMMFKRLRAKAVAVDGKV